MKPKFNIGDYVEARPSSIEYADEPYKDEYGTWHIRQLDKTDGEEYHKTICKKSYKIKGVIVGATRRFLGIHRHETLSGDFNDTYESPYLEITGSKLFWKIRQGYLNKAVEALEEDIRLIEPVKSVKRKQIPLKYADTSRINWKSVSQDSKNWPRDEKGRWT